MNHLSRNIFVRFRNVPIRFFLYLNTTFAEIKPLSEQRAAEYLHLILETLSFMHRYQVPHGSITAESIVSCHGNSKIGRLCIFTLFTRMQTNCLFTHKRILVQLICYSPIIYHGQHQSWRLLTKTIPRYLRPHHQVIYGA